MFQNFVALEEMLKSVKKRTQRLCLENMFPTLQYPSSVQDVSSFVLNSKRDYNSDKWEDITWEIKYNKTGLNLVKRCRNSCEIMLLEKKISV